MITPKQRRAELLNEVPLFLGLVVLWMLLWGSFSVLTVVTGLLLASVVSIGFYLPAVELGLRLNPWFALLFLSRLLVDIASGSVQVAVLALAPRYRASNAIVAVRLLSRSDLVLTLTGISTSIVPGAIVVDVDRERSTLYLHILNVQAESQIDRFRRSVLAQEGRIIMAIGSRGDVESLRRTKRERRGVS
ncbi:MAG: Na+/H+ antiporter subunit E [Cryobacterium sp.]